MAYSSEVYSRAKRIIDERRSAADRDANIKKAGVYAEYPAIRDLDNQLMREMANFTMLMLREQNGLLAALLRKNIVISPSAELGQVIARSNALYARS